MLPKSQRYIQSNSKKGSILRLGTIKALMNISELQEKLSQQNIKNCVLELTLHVYITEVNLFIIFLVIPNICLTFLVAFPSLAIYKHTLEIYHFIMITRIILMWMLILLECVHNRKILISLKWVNTYILRENINHIYE